MTEAMTATDTPAPTEAEFVAEFVAPMDAWQSRQAILKPLQAELINRGLKLLEDAEALIRVGEVEKGSALQALALATIHLV